MYQVKEQDVFDVLEIAIGRLFFPVGYDNWQIALFLKGLAETGKSTIIEIILAMFQSDDIAILAANMEAKFGLEPAHDKRLFACPDMPRDMARTLDQATLQSMISGENVPVPIKNQKAKPKVRWVAHLLFGSNYLPNKKTHKEASLVACWSSCFR